MIDQVIAALRNRARLLKDEATRKEGLPEPMWLDPERWRTPGVLHVIADEFWKLADECEARTAPGIFIERRSPDAGVNAAGQRGDVQAPG